MYEIKWNDGHANWQVRFEDFSRARDYLYHVFHPATLSDEDGKSIGGVRLAEEHEKIRKNHKWFRWIDGDKPAIRAVKVEAIRTEPDFMKELESIE